MFKKEKKKEKKEKEKKSSRKDSTPPVSSTPERMASRVDSSTQNPRISVKETRSLIEFAELPQQNSGNSAPFRLQAPVVENKEQAPGIDAEDERDEEGLVFSDDKQGSTFPVIKGGNIVKLVERLTYWKYNDSKFVKAFMLTFRSFTTPNELLDLLIQRYNLEPPSGATEEEITNWSNQVLKVVRLRVFNIIKDWLSNGFYDFDEDPQLFGKLNSFSQIINPAWKSQLEKVIQKKKTEGDATYELSFGDQKPPPPHLPRQNINSKDKSTNILTFHPEELARQLTLIEFKLYGKIKPQECLNQNWMHKTQKNELAPNILRMIGRFNEVSTWVASEIVKTVDLAQRAKVLKHVIEIAEFCKSLNNFNALMEIISGLNSSSIFRLKQTWALLPKGHQKSLDEMNALMARGSTNYKNFRAYLHNVNPPCIPYLGVYLTDLTFIEEGNKDNLPDGNINFMKRQRLAEVIAEIQTYQNTPYCLEEVGFIRDYLLNAESLPEEQCYKLSLKREGKEGAAAEVEDTNDEPFGEMEKIPDYPFDTPDTDANITFEKNSDENSSPIVISGTTVKLVERLTHRSYQDIGFLNAFLMNLHKITNPTDLFGLLETRSAMPKPKNPSKQQLLTFMQTRVLPVHLRILNVIKAWVNNYFEDFNEALIQRVVAFLEKLSEKNKGHSATIDGIRKVIEKKSGEGIPIYRNKVIGSESAANEDLPNVASFSPLELAQQITAIDQKIFSNVRPRECLCEEWVPMQMASVAPNLLGMRNAADAVKRWVCTEILTQNNTEDRFKVIVNLIFTVEKLLQLRNFNSAVAIMQGFRIIQPELERIGIWDWLPNEASEKFKELEVLKVPSRVKALEKAEDTKRTIPYIETAISQFTHINNMLPDFTGSGKLINFEKLRKLYEVVESWNRYQSDPFKFKPSPCASYLMKVKVCNNDEIKKLGASLEKISMNEHRPDISDLMRSRLRAESLDQSESLSENISVDQDSSTLDESSPPTSPRTETEREENDSPDQIRAHMLSIINDDKDFLREVVEFAKTDLAHDLLSELRKFTDCVRDEIALSHSLMGINSNGDAACGRVLCRLFPEEMIDQIVEYDSEGYVYGWEEEVSLFRVQSADRCLLTHIAPHIGKSDLGTTFRLFHLFHKREETEKEIKYVIISPSITEDARLIAENKGVILMDFY